MTESKRQTKIIKELEAKGYYVVKLIKTNKNGIPDLLCFNPREFFFVEVKTPKGKLSPLQKHRKEEIEAIGVNVKVWINFEENFNI